MSLPKTFGRLFAVAQSDEQAEMLNAAGEMMRRSFPEGVEMQMSYIVDNLNDDGKRFIRLLARFVGDEK
jgi:hypothetical protein